MFVCLFVAVKDRKNIFLKMLKTQRNIIREGSWD
jgi:hypothetical protein